MPVRIGTSGFLYDHWRHRFYEPSSRARELETYASHFDTVELNVTFYRMPSSASFRSWATRVPDGFLYAVKASRYLTHVRRLRQPREPVEFLLERAFELGSHLGPILLQLPPDLPVDVDRLGETLAAFPSSVRVAVEPRHDSWFTDEVRDLLAGHRAALCLADRRGPVTPTWRTADWTYIRFHGGRASPPPCYGERALTTWASTIHDGWGEAPEAFAYFNNDHRGCALRDAAIFARLLARHGIAAGERPDPADRVLAGAARPIHA